MEEFLRDHGPCRGLSYAAGLSALGLLVLSWRPALRLPLPQAQGSHHPFVVLKPCLPVSIASSVNSPPFAHLSVALLAARVVRGTHSDQILKATLQIILKRSTKMDLQ